MTAAEFRNRHGDPTTWTTADHEAYEVLRHNDQHLANRTLPGGTTAQGKGPATKAATGRLRPRLARAA